MLMSQKSLLRSCHDGSVRTRKRALQALETVTDMHHTTCKNTHSYTLPVPLLALPTQGDTSVSTHENSG